MRIALLTTIALPVAATSADAAVTISTAATRNVSCSAGVCTATAANAVLNASDLESMLAASSVQVVEGSVAGSIDVKAALSWASSKTLTFDAYQSVTVDKPVSVSGSGGLTILTDDGGTGGSLSFGGTGHVSFLNLTSPLTINGNTYTLVDDIATLASDIAANASGHYALAGSYNATPDGAYSQSAIPTTFFGNLEGLGNTISHLSIDDGTASPMQQSPQSIGMFSLLGEGGIIANLHLTGVSILGGIHGEEVGGLAGSSQAELVGDSVSGKLNLRFIDGNMIGGLVGFSGVDGTISNSWSTANVSGTAANAGGLAGVSASEIDSSYATGSVSADDYVGGLIGTNGGTIDNSYATGAVFNKDETGFAFAGGLVGDNSGDINTSYSTGTVGAVQTGNNVGGLIGWDHSGTLTDNYWNTTTSGITNLAKGCGYPSSCSGVTGLSTAQLQSGLPTGFSSSIWGESPSINGGLPYLLALPPK